MSGAGSGQKALAFESARTLQSAEQFGDLADGFMSEHEMEILYRAHLHGGWWREDGRYIDKPHVKALSFHMAARALFCRDCVEGRKVMVHLGYSGLDDTEEFACSSCGASWTMRTAYKPRTLAIEGGRQSSKSHTGLREFASWVLGYRPWDGTLTAPRSHEANWFIACPVLKSGSDLTIIDKFGKLMRRHIVREKRTSTGVSCFYLDDECGRARVHPFSYAQWERTKNSQDNPLFDPIWVGGIWDEPMPEGARWATMRGLVRNRATWGREIISASFTYSSYLSKQVKARAFNLNGDSPAVFCIPFNIEDNPSLDEAAIQEYLDELPPDQRESWRRGNYVGERHRVYDFDAERDTYDPGEFQIPPEWPCFWSCDPHDVRPYALAAFAISPENVYYVFWEHPEGQAFEDMTRTNLSAEGYVDLIKRKEAEFGGQNRFVRRLMDPRYGNRQQTGLGARGLADFMTYRGLFFDTRFSADPELRHTRVKTRLRDGGLKVSRDCRNTIWSLQTYHYIVNQGQRMDRNPKTDEEGKDFADVVGFACVADLKWRPWK